RDAARLTRPRALAARLGLVGPPGPRRAPTLRPRCRVAPARRHVGARDVPPRPEKHHPPPPPAPNVARRVPARARAGGELGLLLPNPAQVDDRLDRLLH